MASTWPAAFSTGAHDGDEDDVHHDYGDNEDESNSKGFLPPFRTSQQPFR